VPDILYRLLKGEKCFNGLFRLIPCVFPQLFLLKVLQIFWKEVVSHDYSHCMSIYSKHSFPYCKPVWMKLSLSVSVCFPPLLSYRESWQMGIIMENMVAGTKPARWTGEKNQSQLHAKTLFCHSSWHLTEAAIVFSILFGHTSEWNGFLNKYRCGGAWFWIWGIDWMFVVCYWWIWCEWQVAPPSSSENRCRCKSYSDSKDCSNNVQIFNK